MLRPAALCFFLGIGCGGVLAQGLNVPAEKRETRKAAAERPPQMRTAPRPEAGRSERPQRNPRPERRDPVERKAPERASLSVPGAPPPSASRTPRFDSEPPRSGARRHEKAPLRERASIAAPASPPPMYRAPEAAPAARLPVAAEPRPQRQSQSSPGQSAVCSAEPRCSQGDSCRSVEHSYAGFDVLASGRRDIVRACRLANSDRPCCASDCFAAAQCRTP